MHSSLRLFLVATGVVAAFAIHAGPANTCTEPYWKTTLRCAFFPNELPQPNSGSGPALPLNGPVPAFTRVFLENPDVRCTDGTMPLLYVDKAVCTNASGCGNGIALGQSIESNKWLFTFAGGTSCAKEQCVALYADPSERANMGSSLSPALQDMDGIHSADPIANPVFAGYNRVRVDKCTYDRYMGRSADEAPGGAYSGTTPGGKPFAANLYYHGWFIVEEALHALQNGLSYTTWKRNTPPAERRRSCCGSTSGPQWTAVSESLPPLANADFVLVIGHSNASHGLYHNIDNIAALLAQMPGFHADVRAVFDANFQPSLENERSFANNGSGDSYDSVWNGSSQAQGQPFTYDGQAYHTNENVAQQYAHWKAAVDTSCLAAHPADAWKCNDRMHVLVNHIATPFLAREDFQDPNVDHLDAPRGFNVVWGQEKNFAWCPDAQPCTPRFDTAEYRTRITKQMQTLLTGVYTRSELARDIDKSRDKNPTVFAWMPACAQHEGSYGNEPFFGTTIATQGGASFSMRQWVEEFVNAPRNGVRRYKIDGVNDASGGAMTTSKCK